MKILFDNQIFNAQKYGGISRYFVELFNKFNQTKDLKYDIPISDSENEYLKTIQPFSNIDMSKKLLFPDVNKNLRRLLNKLNEILNKNSNRNKTIRALVQQNFDIFHPTYYSTYFLKYLKGKPFVLTVHDMIHEIYPEYFLLDHGRTAQRKKKLILNANKIIAISEHTKMDIVRLYNIPEDKIKVIYHGNSLQLNKSSPINTPTLPPKYILFVGSRSIYKNFTFFVESIAPLLKKDKELNIIVAGGYSKKNTFSEKEISQFEKIGIEQQVIQYSVSDDVLSYLYQHALCFVFPTLYEGFGIPVLESFACNCPAVISNTSSLPEVGGDAALYFDPTNKESIRLSVEKVIYNKALRDEMISKGQKQLEKFSWDKTAKETIDLYAEILQNNK